MKPCSALRLPSRPRRAGAAEGVVPRLPAPRRLPPTRTRAKPPRTILKRSNAHSIKPGEKDQNHSFWSFFLDQKWTLEGRRETGDQPASLASLASKIQHLKSPIEL